MKKPVVTLDTIRIKDTAGTLRLTKPVRARIHFVLIEISYKFAFDFDFPVADKSKSHKNDNEKNKEEPSSFFQRKRVDMLLGELLNKFPLPLPPQHQQPMTNTTQISSVHPTPDVLAKKESSQDNIAGDSSGGVEIKQELMESSPPPSNINGVQQQQQDINDMSGTSIKLETNHMKPPPEKKMKL